MVPWYQIFGEGPRLFFFDFQICSPGMFPQKIGDHIALVSSLDFQREHILPAELHLSTILKNCFYQIKESKCFRSWGFTPVFFVGHQKKMMDHWIILHLLGDSFNIILQQKPQWFLSKHSTMWDHN